MAPVPATTKGPGGGDSLSSMSPGIALAGFFQILLAGMALTGGMLFLRRRRRLNGARLAAQRAPTLIDDSSLTESVRTPVLAPFFSRGPSASHDDSLDDISALLHPDPQDSPQLPSPTTSSPHARFFHGVSCLFQRLALLGGSPTSSTTTQLIPQDGWSLGQHTLGRPPSRRGGDYMGNRPTTSIEVPRIVVTPPYEDISPEGTVSSPASVCSLMDSPTILTPPLEPHVMPVSFLSMDPADDVLDSNGDTGSILTGGYDCSAALRKPPGSPRGLGLTGTSHAACTITQPENDSLTLGAEQETRVTIVAAADLDYAPIREFAFKGPGIVDPAPRGTLGRALPPAHSDTDEGAWEVRLVGAFASSPSSDSLGQREEGTEQEETEARYEDLHRVVAERQPRVCSIGSSFTAEVSEWSVWSLGCEPVVQKVMDDRSYSASARTTRFASGDVRYERTYLEDDRERPLSLSYALVGPVIPCP
ncbi:hypothetical protein C8Q79DRAFT_955351 [Trametes meyenii]|nr:hypothetical protein C8Q79DRAFT_955351 [Trametes meyenii]